MDDHAIKLSLQDAANELRRRFPDRVFALFIMKAEPGHLAHYVSNGPREKVINALNELNQASGFSALPSRRPLN